MKLIKNHNNKGFLHAFNKTSGALFWTKNIKNTYFPNTKIRSKNTFVPNAIVSRNTPAKYLNSFIIGTISLSTLLRIDIKTGKLISKLRLSSHPDARITMSGTVVGNKIIEIENFILNIKRKQILRWRFFTWGRLNNIYLINA